MTKRRSAKGERARARIIAVAERLFAARGFYGTSVRDIAGAAEMPTASLLHHFPTKERLYGAVLSQIANDIEASVGAALDEGDSDVESVRRLCAAYLEWTDDNRERSNLLLRELLDNPARLDGAARFHLAPLVSRITQFARAGQARGTLRQIDPLLFIVQLAGTASYLCAARPTFARIADDTSEQSSAECHRRQLITLMEHALILEQGSPS